MQFMKNKYLVFNNIDVDTNSLENVTELILLPEIPAKFFTEQFILKKEIQDNALLEALAYDIWGSTDYWDILMALNGMTSMFQLPVSHDLVLERANAKLEEWKALFKLIYSTTKQEDIDIRYQEILVEEEALNEKYRTINYISISNMSILEAELNNNRGKVKISPTIISK